MRACRRQSTGAGRQTQRAGRNSDWTKNAVAGTVCRLMPAGAEASKATRASSLLPWGLGLLVLIGGSYAIFSGGFGHRSVAELADVVPIGHDIEVVRIELQNGTVGVDVPEPGRREPEVAYAGGVRRAASDAAELAQLEQIPIRLVPVADPARPRTLVLRGPELPPGSGGLLAFELGIRVPSDLTLEIAVAGSGHITVANRRGRTLIDTGRGDLRFEHCRGPVRAKTGRGMVIAFDHVGDLDLHTVVGDIQAFVAEPAALLRLVSGKGTVQCGVPASCEFDLDARAEIGRIGADFGLVGETVGTYGAALVGKRGSGRTKVVLRTGSGHLAFKEHRFP